MRGDTETVPGVTRQSVDAGEARQRASGQVCPAHREKDGEMTTAPNDHNQPVSDATYNVAADELRQIIERIERIEAEIADQRSDIKEFYSEAKGRGYDTKVLRKIIALRKRDKDDIAEEEAVMEMYKAALGM